MAYSNYGGRVTRNGVRMMTHEDRTPYQEQEQPSTDYATMKHAILGSGRVRFCAHKINPELWLDRQVVNLEPYCISKDSDGEVNWRDGGGELEGHRFAWTTATDRNLVTITLVEPDGSLWLGYSGYGTGAGWDDEEE